MIEEEVLGLEIAVDDVIPMKILERQYDPTEIKPRDVRCESARATEVGKEFASGYVGEEHVHIEVVLERRV